MATSNFPVKTLVGVLRVALREHVLSLHPRDESSVARNALVLNLMLGSSEPSLGVLAEVANGEAFLGSLESAVNCI